MHLLADVGLTNREACYNTVRNVTACPWAGIAQDEVFDVRPYAQRLALRLAAQGSHRQSAAQIQIRLRRLPPPRLHSGRHQRCRPARRDPRRPARLPHGHRRRARSSAHGGATARRVRSRGASCSTACEAVIRVFNQHGNRKNKNKARMKFVHARARLRVAEGGDRKEYQDILAERRHRLAGDGSRRLRRLPVATPSRWATARCCPWCNLRHPRATPLTTRGSKATCVEQKQTGYAAVIVAGGPGQPHGRPVARPWPGSPPPPATAWCASASTRTWCWPSFRSPGCRRFTPRSQRARAGDGAARGAIDDVLTCPGAYTCNLGSPRP